MAEPLFTRVDRPVGKLVSDVIEGRVGLPDLQRPFVWKDSDVRDLLDSMLRGYPIGYCILWEAPDDQEEKKVSIGLNEKNYATPKELVIDGQQRLTALVSSMYGVPVKDQSFSDRTIRIAYDPIAREFHTWDAAIAKDAKYIPDLSAVFEAKRKNEATKFRREYIKRLNEANAKREVPELDDDGEAAVEDGINELLDLETTYVIPILSISNKADEEQMSQIFIRVNSGGTKLNEDDFIMTLLSVYEPETRQRIEDWCEDSHKPGVGTSYNALLTIKPSHVIRATVGLGFGRGRLRYARLILNGRDLETRETSVAKREENFEKFDAALDKVLDLNDWHAFINALGEAGYVNGGMVSSENTIPLTYAITLIAKHRFGITGMELQRIAKRWFSMAILTQMYTGNFESVFEQQMNSIDELTDADAFCAWIENEISSRLTDDYYGVTLPNELDKNKASGPVWNGFLAAQVVLGSRVLFNTSTVAQLLLPASSGTKKAYDKHHLFPANFLKNGPYEYAKDRRANFVCVDYQKNIYISDEDPKIYVAKFKEALGDEAYKTSCTENALPLGFEDMEYLDFLKERRVLMSQMIKNAFSRL
ncbi:GmrSD restriction endonuclease domain-containing protein [Trueperella pyogenes]